MYSVGDGLVHCEHELQGIQFPLEDDLQQFGRRPGLAKGRRYRPAPLLVMHRQLGHPFRQPKEGLAVRRQDERVGREFG
jgi:hypothetical protein